MRPTLVRELYSAGYLSPDEFRFLEEIRTLRATIVHGLAPVPFEESIVRKLIDLGSDKLEESDRLEPAVA
jgi:hypothetical protein